MTDTGRGAPTRGQAPRRAGAGQDARPAKEPNTLQTLDRGLRALAAISGQEDGLSVADLAARLGVHRAITYRLAKTLEAHGLVARGAEGRLFLGAGLLGLASRFEPQLRSVARPLLHELAQETRAAAFLSVPQGEECVAIMVAEPEGGLLRLAYRVGSRHPLTLGAAGIAILAGRPLARKRICRTFSDCTTAPRNAMASGCYPLDPFYKDRPERQRLAQVKARFDKMPAGADEETPAPGRDETTPS